MRMRRMTVVGLAIAAAIACTGAWPQESVDGIITKSRGDERMVMAVPACSTAPGLENIGRNMAALLMYDLDFSGVFRVLMPHEFPVDFQGLTPDPTQIDFDAWRKTDAEFLVHIHLEKQGNQYVAKCRLFDLLASQQIIGKQMAGDLQWLRLIGHQFSEEILRYLTGIPGSASSQICFSGGATGDKEIYIADYDGANLKQVTEHKSISILPKFSPNGRKIAYLSFKDRYPFLYVLDLDTGRSAALSKNVGLNVAPAWAPDGKRLAVVLSKDANAEIYMVNADGSGKKRLTNNAAVDTSPTFDPSGEKIAFISERSGSPQVFVMNADGSDVKRLSYQGGRAYDPVWSPDGLSIAYVVERRGEGLEIYCMRADGSNPRPLTSSTGSNENPSWSPDSRHVVYASTRSGRFQLWTTNVETLDTRQVPHIEIRSQGPSWGPRRK